MTTAGYKKLKAALNAQERLIKRSPEAASALIDSLGIRDILVTPAKPSSKKKSTSPKAS